MTQSKHTQGPWVARKMMDGRNYVQIGADPADPERRDCGDGSAADVHGLKSDANARLIAAAPEMLEALRDIVAQAERTKMPIPADLADSIRVFARAAIRKATGGEG